jgi:ectoine hydroxylase-related dioxygenase (phytanoyl-CoA dioxygenase family)
MCDEGLVRTLKSILNSDNVFSHMPPMVRFVEPNYPYAAVPIHNDVTYNSHLTNFITIWVPLVPTSQLCQGVLFYEGKEENKVKNSKNKSNFWFDGLTVDESKAKHFDMEPGDIVIFSSDKIHGSGVNVASYTRYSIDFRCFRQSNDTTKHYINLSTVWLS